MISLNNYIFESLNRIGKISKTKFIYTYDNSGEYYEFFINKNHKSITLNKRNDNTMIASFNDDSLDEFGGYKSQNYLALAIGQWIADSKIKYENLEVSEWKNSFSIRIKKMSVGKVSKLIKYLLDNVETINKMVEPNSKPASYLNSASLFNS